MINSVITTKLQTESSYVFKKLIKKDNSTNLGTMQKYSGFKRLFPLNMIKRILKLFPLHICMIPTVNSLFQRTPSIFQL